MAFPVKNIALKLDREDLEILLRFCGMWLRPVNLEAAYNSTNCMAFLLNELAFRHTPKLLKLQKVYHLSLKQSELSAINIMATSWENLEISRDIRRILSPILNQI
jgi:hypothetical protein